jgi:oxygen-independent coproporphyrinogen-3 oxidase
MDKLEYKKDDNSVALYIHIPFCKQKCLYCDFPSFSGREKLMLDYSKALAKDIENVGKRSIKTIFIGGGTPTYLSLEAWDNIKNALDKLNKSGDLEFSIEGNPGTFTEEKLKFFKTIGVNRLSIGLQAWQDCLLKRLGRIHTIEQFVEGYRTARNLGFDNINIDLMFGLPNQTLSQWKETLYNCIKLKPEHISCYSLIIEEGTPFCKMYEEDKLNTPEEESEREMYNYAVYFLKLNGYEQYEISNFSLQGKECRHNLVYWNLEKYIGCGSSAHSYIDGFRYRKAENIEEYISDISLNKNTKIDIHKNSLEDDMEEFMFMGLRKTNGISLESFQERFKKDIDAIYGDVIKKYICNDLLILKNDRLFLSKRGIEISNIIMSDFII